MPHLRRARLASRHPVLVTMKLAGGVPSPRQRRTYTALVACLHRGADRRGFRVVHFSMMHDHIHLIVEAKDAEALSRGMQGLSVRFARALNRVAGRKGTVFADRYHSRVLKTPREVRFGLRYVLGNGRKHRYVPSPARGRRDWVDPYSSACWFDGWKRKVRFPRDREPLEVAPAVPPPRTWLLRVGWRRHGLLDPASVPGRPDG